MNGHFSKPINFEEMQKTLAEALKMRVSMKDKKQAFYA